MWKSLLLDFGLYCGLGTTCALFGVMFYPHANAKLGMELWFVAVLISVGCGTVISFLTLSPVHRSLPVAMPLIGLMIRTGIYLGVLLYLGATKWSHQNYFTACLLACYFPFLALESFLSIRRSSPT